MARETYATQLETVEAAIKALVQGAQSYTIGDRTLIKANLKDLREERDFLIKQTAKEARSGGLRFRKGEPR